jgi:3-deoxy-D-manno-octulosonic acid (KDO) 8-phosphate synthase
LGFDGATTVLDAPEGTGNVTAGTAIEAEALTELGVEAVGIQSLFFVTDTEPIGAVDARSPEAAEVAEVEEPAHRSCPTVAIVTQTAFAKREPFTRIRTMSRAQHALRFGISHAKTG